MTTTNTRIARTDAVVAAMKRLTANALRFDGASREGLKAAVQVERDDSGRALIVAFVQDEDETYGGHVTRDVAHWWSSLAPAQRAWVKENGRVFHCHGRMSGVEIVINID